MPLELTHLSVSNVMMELSLYFTLYHVQNTRFYDQVVRSGLERKIKHWGKLIQQSEEGIIYH